MSEIDRLLGEVRDVSRNVVRVLDGQQNVSADIARLETRLDGIEEQLREIKHALYDPTTGILVRVITLEASRRPRDRGPDSGPTKISETAQIELARADANKSRWEAVKLAGSGGLGVALGAILRWLMGLVDKR